MYTLKGWNTGGDPHAKDSLMIKLIREFGSFWIKRVSMRKCVFPSEILCKFIGFKSLVTRDKTISKEYKIISTNITIYNMYDN